MRLLLIDDEEMIRKGTALLLQQLEMDIQIVGEAEDGEEGLDKLRLLAPDVALIDIRMPMKNGLELMKEVYEQRLSPATKYVILTAHSEFEYAQTAMRYGACDFLLKPLSVGALQELFARIAPAAEENKAVPANIGVTRSREFLESKQIKHELVSQLIQYIGMNYMKDIQLNDVADHFNVSPVYASNVFKKVTGTTFISYLQQFRVELAKALLASGEYKISEVAYMVGYGNLTYFSRVFKSVEGVTPGDFLRSQHDQKRLK
ncbi:response regulator transcription factor [Paenibacillus thalictri]|uniref:Response regulator n=1 Tax=Paenibacillus thalictri TaxID=2527873 RepID=A0A4Q9DLZ6_9BACL|nr:response regulator [Paenibacillus thalictri]TBL76267.1 response regulator [Paenibacillus thalictri]